MDKAEHYIVCPMCYHKISAFHRPLRKNMSLEELDTLEDKMNKKFEAGKLKEQELEILKVCFEEKRREIKVSVQMLAEYESSHEHKAQNLKPAGERLITTADTLQDRTIKKYLGPVSAQRLMRASEAGQEEELNKIKQELSYQLFDQAEKMGGSGVIGLKYNLTSVGDDKLLFMADATAVSL